MTAPIARAATARTAPAVRAGAVTQAERDTLTRKIAAAKAAQQPSPPPASPPPSPPAPSAAPKPAAPSSSPSAPRPRLAPPRWLGRESPAQTGAGLIVGFLFWAWIALPLIRGGPTEVRNTLRAKFLNKAPDGRWLP